MARGETFAGQTRYIPGAAVAVRTRVGTVNSVANGVVGLIGESEGGTALPLKGVAIDDPMDAYEVLGTGALADAVGIAFSPSASEEDIPGGASRVYVFRANSATKASTHVAGDESEFAKTVAGGATVTLIPVTVSGMTADAHIGKWLKVSTNEKRRIVDNASDSFTVAPGFSAVPSGTVDVMQSQMVLTAKEYGLGGNRLYVEFEAGAGTNQWVITIGKDADYEQSPSLCGTDALRLTYLGGAIASTGTVSAAVAGPPTTVSFLSSVAAGANAWQGMVLQVGSYRRRIQLNTLVNNPGDSVTVTLDNGNSDADVLHGLSTAEAAAIVGSTVNVRNVTTGTATMAGSAGLATGMTTAILPVADNQTWTWASLGFTTLAQLASYVNVNTAYQLTVPSGINADTTLLSSYDFGTRATAVDIRFDSGITDSKHKMGTFRRDLQEVVDWVNNNSQLATAAKATGAATEGAELPAATGGVYGTAGDIPVYFYNGTRGSSTNSNWQTCFDEALKYDIHHVVPLIDQDLANEGNGSTATLSSVMAQLGTHVSLARGAMYSKHRGGYASIRGTKTVLLAQARTFNTKDVCLSGHWIKYADVLGTAKNMAYWSFAVAVAGSRAGAARGGTPLTWKYLRALDIGQDSSWDPLSITDQNDLLRGGVLFAKSLSSGIRIERDITTYVQDDTNDLYIDGNTVDAGRIAARYLNENIAATFTGQTPRRKASPGSVREMTSAWLNQLYDEEILSDSEDPDNPGVIVKGWHKLSVYINGHTLIVRVRIFPIFGIVFEDIEIEMQIARLTG